MSDLVAKLRNPSFPPESRLQDDARELMQRGFEAAARIEALEAENARLKAEQDAAIRLIREVGNIADRNMDMVGKVKRRVSRQARAAMEPTND